jgi:hypothetical protein
MFAFSRKSQYAINKASHVLLGEVILNLVAQPVGYEPLALRIPDILPLPHHSFLTTTNVRRGLSGS